MKIISQIALTTILSGTLAVVSSTTLASNSGLPSSTSWQAWNNYVSQPSQGSRPTVASGVPSSTNWQDWNDYMSRPNRAQVSTSQAGMPSSTNWQAWNQYFAKN